MKRHKPMMKIERSRNGVEEPLEQFQQRVREKYSARYKGFPNQSVGAASAVRRLTPEEFEARRRELEKS